MDKSTTFGSGRAPNNAGRPELTATDVSVRFGGVRALEGASLEVFPGTITALIGPNGAGKTTLLNVISGVVRAQRGRVELEGADITRFTPPRRAQLGILRCFQSPRLFDSLSVLENVGASIWMRGPWSWDAARDESRSMELLDRCKVPRRSFTSPAGLNLVDRKRVEIARALTGRPKVLLLDEPAAGMGRREADALIDLIRELQADLHVAVLIVEHNMPLVMDVADSITVLNFGAVIASGDPAAIRSDPNVIAA